MIRFMLKNHLKFISIICLLLLAVQIKNTFFSFKTSNLITTLPNGLNSEAKLSGPLNDFPSPKFLEKQTVTNESKSLNDSINPPNGLSQKNQMDSLEKNSNKVKTIKIEKNLSSLNSKESSASNDRNNFLNTYQKFALLEFNKNIKTQFVIDLKEMPKEFLSIGFTVDKGSLTQPKVEVRYTNGSFETLSLPFNEMFQDDWVKLETNPNLKIESLNVSALSPVDKSIFSFFIQEHL